MQVARGRQHCKVVEAQELLDSFTSVVRTPHSPSSFNTGGVAFGVSINSNSLSLPVRLVGLDMLARETATEPSIANCKLLKIIAEEKMDEEN